MNHSKFGLRILLATCFSLFLAWIIVTSDRGSCTICGVVKSIPLGDKVGHLVLYGVLTFVIGFLRRWPKLSLGGVSVLRPSSVLLVLVALEEASQMFFPARTGDLFDLIASWLGVFAGDWLAQRIPPNLAPISTG